MTVVDADELVFLLLIEVKYDRILPQYVRYSFSIEWGDPLVGGQTTDSLLKFDAQITLHFFNKVGGSYVEGPLDVQFVH